MVTAAGGTPVMSKTGHAFIKERMRKEDAIYGGEMSLRSSNTEPVVRLNVESRGDVPLMEEKTKLILALLNK